MHFIGRLPISRLILIRPVPATAKVEIEQERIPLPLFSVFGVGDRRNVNLRTVDDFKCYFLSLSVTSF
jgi:hypothetical protein